MNHILKVFCRGDTQKSFVATHPILERYDGFVLVQVPTRAVTRLTRQFPVEDVTDLYDIRLPGRTIDTSRPRIIAGAKTRPHSAYRAEPKLSSGPHHYLLQFMGPIKPAWLRAVRKAGGEPRAPWADFAYVVRLDRTAMRKVSELPFVRWLGHLPTRDRIAPSVLGQSPIVPGSRKGAGPLPRTRGRPGVFTVQFFGSDDLRSAVAKARKLGFRVVGKDLRGRVLVVEAAPGTNKDRIQELAGIHGVRSVDSRVFKRPSNDVAGGLMNTARTLGDAGLGLSGAGEKIGICDTGLDSGDPASIHPDFKGRIAAIKSYPITSEFSSAITNPGGNDGPADLDSGHGTHVAGSVLGDGKSSAGLTGLSGPVRGLAYKAKVVFQAVEQEIKWRSQDDATRYGRYVLAGIPLDLGTLFADAYKKGARIHSNSWGGGDPGAYDSQCEQLDRFVWEHKDFCIVVSSGNDGTDRDGDSRINPMSVTSPGTAKNCITVGACENRRPNFDGDTYGRWWPQDYPVAPFRNDKMADDPDEVVPFSSRGPTQDGRAKPDIVAPGTFILSTRSTRIAGNNTGWAPFPQSKLYFHMGGTSMATPLTAGAVAVIRQYLRTRAGIALPSAALLKATLIAGATRLAGYAAASAVVDNHQGFGRVNLDAILAPVAPVSATFVEVTPGLQTGQVHQRDVHIKSPAGRFRVVLAYSDFPGSALVNNVNLLVHAPNGKIYVGNSGGGATLNADTTNNTEVVDIAKPKPGLWSIEVMGSNVPHGPQPFAIVYRGRV